MPLRFIAFLSQCKGRFVRLFTAYAVPPEAGCVYTVCSNVVGRHISTALAKMQNGYLRKKYFQWCLPNADSFARLPEPSTGEPSKFLQMFRAIAIYMDRIALVD